MQNIWQKLSKPIFILAPMEDVTDTVFRQIIIECGKPDLFFTEFTSTDGFLSKGKEKVAKRLIFKNEEKPIIAQIWGNNPDNYFKMAQILAQMGFEGIDINMGCPDRAIVAKGCCSGLIKNSKLASEIIKACKEGARNLPISVKTRIGYDHIETDEWISFLLQQDVAAITVHGRVAKHMSKYPANWEEIGKAVLLRNKINPKTLIIGNGDVLSYEDGINKVNTFGVDGIMVGRGIFHNPWIFSKEKKLETINIPDRIQLLIRHLELYESTWDNTKPYDLMKKYFKIYLQGFDYASELRNKLMSFKNAEETLNFLKTFNYNEPSHIQNLQ